MRALSLAVVVVVFCGCVGDPCTDPGDRTVTVTSSGLPSGLDGVVRVNGQPVTSSGSVTLNAGKVELSAEPAVASTTGLVRTVYLPTFEPAEVCVAPGAEQAIAASWSPVPTSGTLWVLNQNADAQFLGFPAAALTAGAHDAGVSTKTDLGQFTFDKQGNVWAVQGTLASAALNFYPASDFSASGGRTPARTFQVAGLSGCIRGPVSLAFDAAGNLWLGAACDGKVFKLNRDALRASATLPPQVTLTVPSVRGLAFDAAGNLYVASLDEKRVFRFDASQLDADATEPAAKIGVRASTNPADTTLYTPSWLAFDAHGALWFNDFGANVFASIASADLGGTGEREVEPPARITVTVSGLLENFSFDEQGGLWSAGSQGTLIRFSESQLTTSGSPAPDRVITSNDIGYVNGVAMYPAPAGLPLFHALP